MAKEILEKFQQDVVSQLNRIEQAPGPIDKKFDAWIATLASYKQRALLFEMTETNDWTVRAGPFKGLDLQGNHIDPTHLLGLYESALHQHLEGFLSDANKPYRHVLNIGCAFGYYTIGLARRLPDAKFFAYDIDPSQQIACRHTAQKNRVADRVAVAGECQGETFADHPAGQTLVFCDIEGGERALLDPTSYPSLKGFDFVVELHQVETHQTQTLLTERFKLTHDITFVPNSFIGGELPEMLWTRNSLDQLAAIWEGRGEPTPWLIMKAHAP